MTELLIKSGITLNQDQLDRLWRYHNLIRNRNQDRELTRIIEFEAMVVKHYVDCMIVGKYFTLPSPIVDIGTGAGFPGVPLKIRYPHLKMTLAEPRPKRVAFLNEVIQKLELKNTDVFDHKVVSRSFTKPVAAAITRAVETIDKTVLRTSACLGKGGLLIFLKGPAVDAELKDTLNRFAGKFKLVLDKGYTLPGTPHDRRLVVLEKLVDPEISKDSGPAEDEDISDSICDN
jgi:16S rRNA (guanine(527)-N(7))-methyltransferase RsmG